MQTINKEKIKIQMVKTAARLWEIPENEIETSIDPFALLLIEACATEIEKIGFDIENMQSRLLEKLIELLVPQHVLNVRPSSCVAFSTPTESTTTIDQSISFSCTQNVLQQNKSVTNNFHFSPIGKFTLHKAKIEYLFIGNKIYKEKTNGSKEHFFTASENRIKNIRKIHIAVSTETKFLTGLSIYFQLYNHPNPENFYSMLQHAEISLSDNETFNNCYGYYQKEQFSLDIDELLSNGINYPEKINKRTAAIYSKQFMHIPNNKTVTKNIPQDIRDNFPTDIIEKADLNKLQFLTIHFNRNFTIEELEGLNCFINAFPILNKQYHTQHYITNDWINIIPIQSNDFFWDLIDISTTGGKNYKYQVTTASNDINEGQATVRNAGIEKSSSDSIRALIGGLTHAIQNESNYFTELSNELILSGLTDINKILTRFDDQLSKSVDLKKGNTYIILKPKTSGETVNIQYYTTNGDLANQLLPFTKLQAHNHSLTTSDGNYIISKAIGGKSNYTSDEKKNLLQQQIFSKEKIVSINDIKLLCKRIFADNLLNVDIQKGFQTVGAAKNGLKRTIDIYLSVKNMSQEEMEYFKNEVLFVLDQNATQIYPFRISFQII